RILRDAPCDRLGGQALRRNGTDDAEAVACGPKQDGDSAGDRETLLDRLVAVAVAERDLVVADAGGHDRAIRRRGTVQHRVRALRAEYPRRVALAFADGAGMAEHGAERGALD